MPDTVLLLLLVAGLLVSGLGWGLFEPECGIGLLGVGVGVGLFKPGDMLLEPGLGLLKPGLGLLKPGLGLELLYPELPEPEPVMFESAAETEGRPPGVVDAGTPGV